MATVRISEVEAIIQQVLCTALKYGPEADFEKRRPIYVVMANFA